MNDYFARLMKSEQLVPSLDPPSDRINSAKLERHLNHSDGMVVVLTEREGGVSPYIMYEIALAVRGRKPILVFIEDTLPTKVVPRRVLQCRFSRRSFLRQIKQHRHALKMLRSYLGKQAGPQYQPSEAQRSCLVIGVQALSNEKNALYELLHARHGYEPITLDPDERPFTEGHSWWDRVSGVDVVLSLQGHSPDPRDTYTLGAVRGALRPLIALTSDGNYSYSPKLPREYQPRQVESFDLELLRPALLDEFSLFEQDFLDLDDQGEVTRYSQQLIELAGHYGPGTRERVTEVVVGDKFEVHGQAAAVGPNAHVHDVKFSQLWSRAKNELNLKELSKELEVLRGEARARASTLEDDEAVAEIAKAQRAAENGDGEQVMGHLSRAGKWALSIAQSIGVGLATTAIQSAAGL